MKKNKQNKEDLDLNNNTVLGADEIVEEADTVADPDQDLKKEIPPGEEITLPVEEVEGLKSKLDEQEKKAEEYLDGWQRARAEFANYKKRIARDHDVIQQAATGDVIKTTSSFFAFWYNFL